MSRGITPAILAMLDERARAKLDCVIRLHYGTAAPAKAPATAAKAMPR